MVATAQADVLKAAQDHGQDHMSAAEAPPFVKGTGQWAGVVMVIRPARAQPETMCRVASARTVLLFGRRAIDTKLPYQMLRHLFASDDGDHVFAEAEFKDGHLEIYDRSPANLKDWVLYSNLAN